VYSPNASTVALWLNSGTVAFADAGGTGGTSSAWIGGGRFINLAGGTVVKTGTAGYDWMNGSQVENDGAVISQSGVLMWSVGGGVPPAASPSPGDGVSDGSFNGTGTGHVDLGTGSVTVSPQTMYQGSGVWVTGTLQGTVAVAAGDTLNVGADPSSPYKGTWDGTVAGPVSGAGTLNVAGYGSGNNPLATVAGDLNVANVTISNAAFNVKADGTATVIGSGATVTMGTTPVLAPGLSLVNNGTMDFRANDYFTCSSCTVTNKGSFLLNNPDGNFTHSFNINSGSFDNQGLIRMEGFDPGTPINFGGSVNVINGDYGQAVEDLQPPSWVTNFISQPVVQAAANSLPSGLTPLAATLDWPRAAAANVGIANCVNVNVGYFVGQTSAGVCLIVAPDGAEGLSISVSGIATTPAEWDLGKVFSVGGSIDAGTQALWTWDPSTNHQSFSLSPGASSLSWCEGGSLTFEVGIAGQHCWNPTPGVPFALHTLPIQWPGDHSIYLGVSSGAGATLNIGMSYSVVISCQKWLGLGGQPCPPANTAQPVITGSATVGGVLSASTGAWSSISSPTFAYQWERCSTSAPTSCSSISGANSTSYTVAVADRTYWLSVIVTATNSGGSITSQQATPDGPVP
jgi:hypothetical protein